MITIGTALTSVLLFDVDGLVGQFFVPQSSTFASNRVAEREGLPVLSAYTYASQVNWHRKK
ncbi:MAG TPA: hypothetical protein VF493_04675 [Terriglobales bacterium]